MTDFQRKEMTSTPNYHSKIDSNRYFKPPLLILLCSSSGLMLFVVWQFLQSSVYQILKSVFAGFLLVYYSWELIYFDSLIPGIQPPSPLSPPIIRIESGHTLHLNYALAVLIGIFFMLFVNWYT